MIGSNYEHFAEGISGFLLLVCYWRVGRWASLLQGDSAKQRFGPSEKNPHPPLPSHDLAPSPTAQNQKECFFCVLKREHGWPAESWMRCEHDDQRSELYCEGHDGICDWHREMIENV